MRCDWQYVVCDPRDSPNLLNERIGRAAVGIHRQPWATLRHGRECVLQLRPLYPAGEHDTHPQRNSLLSVISGVDPDGCLVVIPAHMCFSQTLEPVVSVADYLLIRNNYFINAALSGNSCA